MPYNQNNVTSNTAFVEHHEAANNQPTTTSNHDFTFDDLIERQPGWLLRSGILLLFGTVLLVVLLASFIRYPDKLPAPFLLTTQNPPIDVVTLSGGQIANWYAADSQQVAKNEVLAYIENPADRDDVETFASVVGEAAAITNVRDYRHLHIPENLQMGELRQVYTSYVQVLASFQHLLRQRIVFQKMNNLKDKSRKQRQLGKAMERRLALFEKELALAEKDYRRNQQLNQEGVVSDLDFEKIETALLQKQQQLENLQSAIIRNKIEIGQLHTQRLELKDARAAEVNGYLVKLDELALQFRNQYSDWKKRYLVAAPIAGTLSVAPGMMEKRMVQAGEAIAAIIPEDTGGGLVARISPPAAGIGKIETGNRVLLQLDAYPYKEFGAVETYITKVSLLPVQGEGGGLYYEVACEVPQPITSATGKVLPFRQKLTGVAQVITKDRSIAERLVERVLAVGQ